MKCSFELYQNNIIIVFLYQINIFCATFNCLLNEGIPKKKYMFECNSMQVTKKLCCILFNNLFKRTYWVVTKTPLKAVTSYSTSLYFSYIQLWSWPRHTSFNKKKEKTNSFNISSTIMFFFKYIFFYLKINFVLPQTKVNKWCTDLPHTKLFWSHLHILLNALVNLNHNIYKAHFTSTMMCLIFTW